MSRSDFRGGDGVWLMLLHISTVLLMWISFGLLSFAYAAFCYWMGKRNFTDDYREENLARTANIQFTAFIFVVFSYVSMIGFIGFIMLPVVLAVTTVLHVIAGFNGVVDSPAQPLAFKLFKP